MEYDAIRYETGRKAEEQVAVNLWIRPSKYSHRRSMQKHVVVEESGDLRSNQARRSAIEKAVARLTAEDAQIDSVDLSELALP